MIWSFLRNPYPRAETLSKKARGRIQRKRKLRKKR